VTNDGVDASVDTWRAATLPLLRRAGIVEGLELKLHRRGAAPGGGGEVLLRVPALRSLPALRLTEEGLVKRVRGTAFTERVSPGAANRLVDAARGVLNALLPDVYVFTDHRAGKDAGASPGFGLSLVAETTTGCVLSADAASRGAGAGFGGAVAGAGAHGDGEEARQTPEALGAAVTAALLEEVARGGAVDSTHQALALYLAAVGPPEVAQLRLGRLTPAAVRFLRDLKDFTGLTFNLAPHADSGTVLATCVGLGILNTARPVT
jgi:RNA 3'-terminal phosphate cyclase-like protein